MENLGTKIRMLRNKHGLTLRELGDKLNLSFSLIAMYERGERTPPVDKLKLLSNFFNVSTDYLLGKIKTKHHPTDSFNLEKSILKNFTLRQIPVLKSVQVENTYISEKNVLEYKFMPEKDFDTKDCFYLQVQDDSMKESRIQAGDLVLVQKNAQIENGDIVLVAVNENETSIKRIIKSDKQVILETDSPKYEPLILKEDEVIIIGKLIRVEFNL